jgi:hypothetical protein
MHLMAKINRFVLLVFRFTHPLNAHAQVFQAMVDVANDDTSDMTVVQLMNTLGD